MTGFKVADLLRAPHLGAFGLALIASRPLRGISTDSRTIKPGEAYLALRGGNHDGHRFASDAMRAGATLCIMDARWLRENGAPDFPCVIVRDTLTALGDLARVYRRRFALPVVGVTGSNGKTGAKDLIAAALSTGLRTLRTEGNLNNWIGAPATLFRLRGIHEAAVLELGTNQPGDIPYLCGICEPTHGLITNIGLAHTEKLLSREGIAAEKAALFRALPPDGTAFVNADEPLLRAHAPRRVRRIAFGLRRGADVRVTSVVLDADARPTFTLEAPAFTPHPLTLRLRMRGRHAAVTAAAALAVGWTLGCETDAMAAAVEKHVSRSGRLHLVSVGGVRIIDDAYNANPDSVCAALDALASMKTRGRRVAALADMLELGRAAREGHSAVGEKLAGLDIHVLFTFGKFSKRIATASRGRGILIRHFEDRNEMLCALKSLLNPGDLILVKGSRGMRMDLVVSELAAGLEATKET